MAFFPSNARITRGEKEELAGEARAALVKVLFVGDHMRCLDLMLRIRTCSWLWGDFRLSVVSSSVCVFCCSFFCNGGGGRGC